MKNILNIEELVNLTYAIKENMFGFDVANLELVLRLGSNELKQINEEFYYRNNPNASPRMLKKADEVIVAINDIKVKFIKKPE